MNNLLILRALVVMLLVAVSTSLSAQSSPLVIETDSIDGIVVGVPSDEIITFKASGGVPPYSWSTLDRPPPKGTKLEVATGVLSGAAERPSGDRPYPIRIAVTDSTGTRVAKDLTLEIRPSAGLDNSKVRPWYYWLMFMVPGVVLLAVVIGIARRGGAPGAESPETQA